MLFNIINKASEYVKNQNQQNIPKSDQQNNLNFIGLLSKISILEEENENYKRKLEYVLVKIDENIKKLKNSINLSENFEDEKEEEEKNISQVKAVVEGEEDTKKEEDLYKIIRKHIKSYEKEVFNNITMTDISKFNENNKSSIEIIEDYNNFIINSKQKLKLILENLEKEQVIRNENLKKIEIQSFSHFDLQSKVRTEKKELKIEKSQLISSEYISYISKQFKTYIQYILQSSFSYPFNNNDYELISNDIKSIDSIEFLIPNSINQSNGIIENNTKFTNKINSIIKLTKAYIIYDIYSQTLYGNTSIESMNPFVIGLSNDIYSDIETLHSDNIEINNIINYELIKETKVISLEIRNILEDLYSFKSKTYENIRYIADNLPKKSFENNLLSKILSTLLKFISNIKIRLNKSEEERVSLNKKVNSLNSELGNIIKTTQIKSEKLYFDYKNENEDYIFQIKKYENDLKELLSDKNSLEIKYDIVNKENLKLKETFCELEVMIENEKKEKLIMKSIFENEIEESKKVISDLNEKCERCGIESDLLVKEGDLNEKYNDLIIKNKDLDDEICILKQNIEKINDEKMILYKKYEIDLKNTEHLIDKRIISKHILNMFNKNIQDDIKQDTLLYISEVMNFNEKEKEMIGVIEKVLSNENDDKLDSWSNWLYNSLIN